MSYDARLKETLESLAETDFDDDAKDLIERALESWFREREGRLANLLDLLDPGRKDPCHRTWVDKSKQAAARAHESFKGVDRGKLWLARIANEEHTFFFNVMHSQVPVKRDRMVKQTQALGKALKEFDGKWAKIKDNDKRIDEKMKKVAQEYQELLNDAAEIAALTEKEAKEKMGATVRQILSIGLQAVDLGIIEHILKSAATSIGLKMDRAGERRLEIHALLSREHTVFAAFKENREVVEEFLEDNGYPQIKDTWDDAEDAAEALEKKMGTDGQKRDAASFGKDVKSELSKVFSVAERAYRDFAKKHEHLFFGPLGGGYIQELMEDQTWKQFSKRWQEQRYDFDDVLRDRLLAARQDKILEVSLDGIEGEDRARVYYTLKDACSELMRAWNKFKEFSDEPEWALESREQLESILKTMR